MSIDTQGDKCMMVYWYNEILLFSNRKNKLLIHTMWINLVSKSSQTQKRTYYFIPSMCNSRSNETNLWWQKSKQWLFGVGKGWLEGDMRHLSGVLLGSSWEADGSIYKINPLKNALSCSTYELKEAQRGRGRRWIELHSNKCLNWSHGKFWSWDDIWELSQIAASGPRPLYLSLHPTAPRKWI